GRSGQEKAMLRSKSTYLRHRLLRPPALSAQGAESRVPPRCARHLSPKGRGKSATSARISPSPSARHESGAMTITQIALNTFYALALAMNMFVIASGLNLIFGVLRVINFAHGMFYMFGAYVTFTVTKSWGAPF